MKGDYVRQTKTGHAKDVLSVANGTDAYLTLRAAHAQPVWPSAQCLQNALNIERNKRARKCASFCE